MAFLSKMSRKRVTLFTPLSLLMLAVFVLEPISVNAQAAVSHEQQHQRPLSSIVDKKLRRVAVIGAGSSGSSTAYYLRKFAADSNHNVDITVYEKSSYVGGRTTTVYIHDNPDEPVELGGSIFVEVNENLVNATRELGLESSDNYISRRQAKDALGVYDGKDFVFRQPYDTTWWNNIAIIWKYGLAPIRTQKLMKQTVGKFLQFYKAPIFPFSSLTEAVEQAGLLQATSHTGEQFLEMNGLSGKFATDLIQASTRVNYAQNLGLIHGLETMVCMATDNAMSVKGGNWKIFKGMLDYSKATVHLNTAVTKLDKSSSDGKWVVHSTSVKEQGDELNTEEFDEVVLASPYQFSKLEIHPQVKKIPDEIPYVKLHVTLFTSPLRLNPGYFNLPLDQEVPDMVLTTLNATEEQDEKIRRGEGIHGVGNTGFFSVSLLRKVERKVEDVQKIEYLYKIFSPTPMSHNAIRGFLGVEPDKTKKNQDEDDEVVTWSHKKLWHSYPYEYPRVTFEEIILDEEKTLFYTSSIESFISTMETSSLMGMNVAKLVVDSWDSKSKKGGVVKEEL